MHSVSSLFLVLLPALLLITPAHSTGDATPAQVTEQSLVPPANDEMETFSDERAGFSVHVRDDIIPYRVMGLFVMPGERVPLQPSSSSSTTTFTVDAEDGAVQTAGRNTWHWTAPHTPGVYALTVTDTTSGERVRLNAFVLTPFDQDDPQIDGYRIGRYEQEPLHDNPVYNPPEGFVQLTEANRDVRVAPHFTLGQFACKQTDTYPQYLLLHERLLLKLELILQEANARGHDVNTLHVMSGFRTPHYNRAIGNSTSYSLHLYGNAADIFIDADGDGHMDDLNDDGVVDEADAQVLASMAEAAHEHAERDVHELLAGGLALYGPAPHRGPFVHVDARGHDARW